MHNSKIKRISLAVCLALMPFAANAAGLGKLTVFSGLGEPLNAEIELSATKEELSSLTSKIAPADTYAEQGLQRPAILANIRLELAQQANGSSVIKLTSPQPIEDPFLDMLIQVEWSNGRLLREYTALLDPPGYGDKASSAAVAPQVTAPAAGASSGGAAKSTTKSGKTRKSAPAKSDGQQAPQGDEYKTRSGDTLRSIAKEMQVEGVSLEQMLVGLYRSNQDAFIDGNMNRLKTGQIMRAPSSEELQSLTQQEAAKEIRVHTSDWNTYRHKLAGAVAETEAESDGAQSQSASGKITAPAEDKGATAPAGPRDVVKLSKSDPAAKASGPESAASREDAIAQSKAAKEADTRVAALEKQLQDMQKLLEIRNKDLANLQKGDKSATAPAPAPVAVTPPPAAPAPVAPPAKEVTPPATPAPVEAAKPAEVPVAAEAKPAEAKPDEAKPAESKKPRRPKRPPPVFEPEPEPDVFEDPLMLGGIGGGLVALLGAGWLYMRNKRRKGLDSFEQGILTTSGLKPNTVFGNTAGGMVDTGDTSFLTDLSQGNGGMIDTNDVDPIAEAEVYMAYGRDVQAEEILKDAIVKEPRRFELHQKLLEIYSNRKDTTAFETLAGELYATLGPTDATWQKFAAMGHALEPANPLYQANGAPVAAVAADVSSTQELTATVFEEPEVVASGEEIDTDGLSASQSFAPDESSTALEPAETIEDNSLDFDLGDFGNEAAQENGLESTDLDLNSSDTVEVPELPEEVKAVQDDGLDFSFDLPEPALEQNVQLDAVDIGLETEPETPAQDESTVQDTVMLDLDALPELEIGEAEAPVAAEPVVEDISFDLPELGIADEADSSLASAGSDESVPVINDSVDVALELPEAVLEEVIELQGDASAPVEESAADAQEISFDLPEEVAIEPAAESVVEMAELELPSLDLDLDSAVDMDKTMVFQAPEAAEEIVFESTSEGESALDFDFDSEVAAEASSEPVLESATDNTAALPDLDLSGISLEMDEPAPIELESAPVIENVDVDQPIEEVEEITLSGSESADVDTKLDLVAAYMDMGDTEGARELLEEVLREGGPQQRERAQGLLETLG